MRVKPLYGDLYPQSNTHGFHSMKRDCRDSSGCENHSLGISCLEVPNVGTSSPQYRPNIAHLVTILVPLRDSFETHLSTGGVQRKFVSKQRRAGRDDSGEVRGHPARFLRTLGEMGSPDDGQDGRRSSRCHQKGRPVAVVGVKPG